jgi:hypothetical protein
MDYNEFKNKYNGQVIDYDGEYGGQCWDLAQQYFTECLGVPENVLGGCGLVNNMLNEPKISELLKYFDEVSLNDMKQGDIVIWTYGHIAILDNWDGEKNWYFTQNPGVAHIDLCDNSEARAFRLKQAKLEQKEENIDNTPIEEEKPIIEEQTVIETPIVELKIGDKVKIVAEGNGSSYGDSNTAYGIGWEREILDIYPDREFPYQIGNETGTTGFYKKEALQKI